MAKIEYAGIKQGPFEYALKLQHLLESVNQSSSPSLVSMTREQLSEAYSLTLKIKATLPEFQVQDV